MRKHTARTLLIMLALSLPAGLSAQRAHGGEFRHFPTIPHAPEARAPGRAEPLVEPGRPPATVPYVRDEHWYGHAPPNDPHFQLAHPFQFGHFGPVGPSHVFAVARFDLAARRIWLPGGMFQIAPYDWAVTAPWCWTCDQFVVYLDPDHPGWYLVYDVRMGEYVHAEFLGA